MSVRTWFSVAAFGLSALAAAVSLLDGDLVELAFFALTALAASTQAWCVREPDNQSLMRVAKAIAVAWLGAAAWVGVLLSMYQASSRPPTAPEAHYLGLTATAYHLLALYVGALLVTLAAFGPRRLDR